MRRPFPETGVPPSGMIKSVVQMVDELNKLGTTHNIAIELDDRPHNHRDAVGQFGTAALMFAVSHITLEAQHHIDDHEGFACAEAIVEAYTGVFGEILKDAVTQIVKEVHGHDLFVEKTHNESLADEILQEIK